MKKKKGELYIISLFICACIIIVILLYIIIAYFQINTVLIGVKDSIFSITQNAIIAYDKNVLPYEVYNVDMEKLRNIMSNLLYKNHVHEKSKIQNIQIKELYLINNKNECIIHTAGQIEDTFLHVNVEVSFRPIVNPNQIATFSIHEDVKLALMKY